jgi:Ca2+-transporting ATPase
MQNRKNTSLFSTGELLLNILQGLAITAGVMLLYYRFMQHASLEVTRTVVFTTLLISNTLLTFADRSFTEPVTRTVKYRNNLAPVILVTSASFLLAIHLIPAVRRIFGMEAISLQAFLLCFIAAFICVAWFEIYKAVKHRQQL